MQRTAADGGIIISCDFCQTDWDAYDPSQANPMIEGHQGSVICLACVRRALEEIAVGEGEYACTLCRREHLPAERERWSSGASAAIVCRDCLNQAAGAFSKDPDVAWQRER